MRTPGTARTNAQQVKLLHIHDPYGRASHAAHALCRLRRSSLAIIRQLHAPAVGYASPGWSIPYMPKSPALKKRWNQQFEAEMDELKRARDTGLAIQAHGAPYVISDLTEMPDSRNIGQYRTGIPVVRVLCDILSRLFSPGEVNHGISGPMPVPP